MPYIKSDNDEFLEAVNESLFVKKKTVLELLSRAEKTLRKKLKTIEDCDDEINIVDNECAKFNECIQALMKCKQQYDRGELDHKSFAIQVKDANVLLKKNCKSLQIQLGNVIDDTKAVTTDEIRDFNEYITGIRRIVKTIRQDLVDKARKEASSNPASATESMEEILYSAFESKFDLEELEAEDEKVSKKKGKDTTEDDFDGETVDDSEEEDEDSKKKKKKSKKSDDEEDDEDDSDDEKDSKDEKDSDDDSDDEEEDEDKDDDEDDKKKSKKKSKKSDDDEDEDDSDDDSDDEEEDEDEDSKKKKKKSKKSDDEEDDEDEDSDDDEEDAKEAAYNNLINDIALEAMSTRDISYDAALSIARAYVDKTSMDPANEDFYYGLNFTYDLEEMNREYAAKIRNMLEFYNSMPEGPGKVAYGDKIAKKIKSTANSSVLQKYGVWDSVPPELRVYYNANAQKKADKYAAAYSKKQAKLLAKQEKQRKKAGLESVVYDDTLEIMSLTDMDYTDALEFALELNQDNY